MRGFSDRSSMAMADLVGSDCQSMDIQSALIGGLQVSCNYPLGLSGGVRPWILDSDPLWFGIFSDSDS